MSMYDVLIIGAGPGGIFTAYELIERRPDLKIAIFEHDIVDVGAEMTYGGIEEMETMLHAGLLELRAGRRVELRALAAELEVDLIDILHQLDGGFLSDILVERAAEIVRDVVLSIRESTGTTETAHD